MIEPACLLPPPEAQRLSRAPWVFAYGSLMWNPGFAFQARVPARLMGFHRAFCVYSWHHRGTRARPGLVLGLDRGGSCRGMAYRVARRAWPGVLDYLRARELVTSVYRERARLVRPLLTGPGGADRVEALVYIADRNHPQYAGRLDIDAQARLIAHGQGHSGRNLDYLADMLAHLDEIGVHDSGLSGLLTRARHIAGPQEHFE